MRRVDFDLDGHEVMHLLDAGQGAGTVEAFEPNEFQGLDAEGVKEQARRAAEKAG